MLIAVCLQVAWLYIAVIDEISSQSFYIATAIATETVVFATV